MVLVVIHLEAVHMLAERWLFMLDFKNWRELPHGSLHMTDKMADLKSRLRKRIAPGSPGFSQFVEDCLDGEDSDCELLSDSASDDDNEEDRNFVLPESNQQSSSETETEDQGDLPHDAPSYINSPSSTRRVFWKRVPSDGFQPLPPAPTPENQVRATDLSPHDYFSKYIPADIIKDLTTFTNIRYLKDTGKVLALTETEMRKFLGITVTMSYLRYPRIRMYWAAKTRVPSIADHMTRDRYFLIRHNLKLVDDDKVTKQEKENNKFWKVRPILKSVLTACLLNTRSENVSVDEQIIPFWGHVPGRQYVKGKPNPCGLKMFVAATPEGLPLDFFLYEGQNHTITEDKEAEDLDLGGKAVIRLTENFEEGSVLYMDRYFTSIPLLDTLHFHAKCQGTGTLQKSRIPSNACFKTDQEMKRLGRGTSDQLVRNDGQISLVKWFDNKPVILASSCDGVAEEDECRRWSKKDKAYVTVKRPSIVRKYNIFMGGVDFLDRVISYYRIFFRTRKWTVRVMMHMLDFAIAASWIEYRKDQQALGTPKKEVLDLLSFRIAIEEYLMDADTPTSSSEFEAEDPPPAKKFRGNVPHPSDHRRRKGALHLPEIPMPARKNRCRLPGCTANSTKIRCSVCKVYLCCLEGRECFKLYHEL